MIEVYFLITGATMMASAIFALYLLSSKYRARLVIRNQTFEAICKSAYWRAWDEAKREYMNRTHRPVTTKSSEEIILEAARKFNEILDEAYDGL
jgi:hypothetical protein